MNDTRVSGLRKGDAFPEDVIVGKATCPARGPRLFQALCVLTKGHAGQHVAINANDKVIEAWG